MSEKSSLELLDDLINEIRLSCESAVPKACVNALCKGPDCTCGEGCTCGVSAEVSCDPCNDFKAKAAQAQAHLADKKKQEKEGKAAVRAKPAVASSSSAPAPSTEIDVNAMDFRVGVITKVWKHETADKLYCEEIDVGEPEPRLIASGLVPYYSEEQMLGRRLIVVCNLKARNLVGFKSHGMVLCASQTMEDGSALVEFVDPPTGSAPGDRLFGEGLTSGPFTVGQCDKRKCFEVVAADLMVDAQGVARWKALALVNDKGETCSAPTLRSVHIH